MADVKPRPLLGVTRGCWVELSKYPGGNGEYILFKGRMSKDRELSDMICLDGSTIKSSDSETFSKEGEM